MRILHDSTGEHKSSPILRIEDSSYNNHMIVCKRAHLHMVSGSINQKCRIIPVHMMNILFAHAVAIQHG